MGGGKLLKSLTNTVDKNSNDYYAIGSLVVPGLVPGAVVEHDTTIQV